MNRRRYPRNPSCARDCEFEIPVMHTRLHLSKVAVTAAALLQSLEQFFMFT